MNKVYLALLIQGFMASFIVLASAGQSVFFSEDPLHGVNSSDVVYISGQFMQLYSAHEADAGEQVHTGIDVTSDSIPGHLDGEYVYPPVPPWTAALARVWLEYPYAGVEVLASVQTTQETQWLGVLHVDALVGGSWTGVNINTAIGIVDGGHVHLELSVDGQHSGGANSELCNPSRYAFSNASWNADGETPRIIEVLYIQTNIKDHARFQIKAYDSDGRSSEILGIGGCSVWIDLTMLGGFDFDRYLSNYWGNYYVWPYPSSPDYFEYIVHWNNADDETHTFRIYVWDHKDRRTTWADLKAGPTIPNVQIVGGDIIDNKIFLKWEVRTVNSIKNFDVYRAQHVNQLGTKINMDPILAIDGNGDEKQEFEFVDELPHDWVTLWYRIYATSPDGKSYEATSKRIDHPPFINEVKAYPNPFNPKIDIKITVDHTSNGIITIYDITGVRIKTLYEGELPRGNNVLSWEGVNDNGDEVASGVYLVRVAISGEVFIHKIVLVK